MKRVLIIEDEKPLRDVYSLILEASGYKVSSAENGKIGLKKLESFKPDLILLDILMPVMDGITFLKSAELKKNYPTVKTIVVSNLSDPLKENPKKYGVVQCCLKVNLSPDELVSVVKNTLS